MRKSILEAKGQLFTYSKDYMSGNFPLVNENEMIN